MSSGAIGFLWLVYFGGMLASGMVFRARAGIGIWRRMKVTGEGGFGLGWTLAAAGKTLVWPIVLVVWLVQGRPEPRVVFNDKARERQQRQAAAAAGEAA